jgi:hypothetical protein
MTTVFLLPKSSGVNIRPGDRLYFLGDGSAEVTRSGRAIGLIKCAYCPEMSLAKRASPEQAEGTDEEKKSKLPPGSRWITVHPHGDDGKGVPLLIQEHPDGSAHVLGGAGGKLNLLHLDKLRSPEEWKESSKERQKKRKQKELERQESQTDEEKAAESEAKEKVAKFEQTSSHTNALDTIKALDSYGVDHGLTAEHKLALSQPPDPGSEPEKVREWTKLTSEATQKVKEIHKAYEQKLLGDHEARAAARLGDGSAVVENQSHDARDAQGKQVSGLQQFKDGWLVQGLGGEAQKFDSWEDAIKAHVANVELSDQENNGGDRSQPDDFYNPERWGKAKTEELDNVTFKSEAAAAIAKLSFERKYAEKLGRDEEKKIRSGFTSGIELGSIQEITQQEVLDKLEAEAKTLEDAFTNHDFLKLVEGSVDGGDGQALRGHSQVGGYAKLAEIASDVLKQNPLSRSLVDAIGHSEAAKVLAYQMQQALTPTEYERVATAQAAYHAQTSSRLAKATAEKVKPMLEEVQNLHEQMLALEQGAGGLLTPDQQLQMDGLIYDAQQLNSAIQQQLGTALGQLEASAAMSLALEAQPKTLRFNNESTVKAVARLVPELWGGDRPDDSASLFEGYGLTADDFKLVGGAEGDTIQVNESGLKKLAEAGYNPEDTEAYNKAIAIKRGDFDQEDFLPAGFARRPRSTFTDGLTESQKFDTKFEVLEKLKTTEPQTMSLFGNPEPAGGEISDGEIEQGLRSYIGARVANGENPLDVMSDVRSPEFYMQQGLDPYGDSALRVQNLAANLVKQAAGGDRISDKAVIQAFQSLGDEEAGKQRRARQTDDLQTLHAQTIDAEFAKEAGHRTLAAMPIAKTVFKSWEQLTAQDRKLLRIHAITEVWGQDLKEPPQKPMEEKISSQIAEEQYDLFGNKISAAEALGGDSEDTPELGQWQEFSKLMGGDQKAYAAVRDHLRGKFMHRFANAYGAIAGKPMLMGGEKIQHVDRLLLAKMPEDQRNEMLEFMRSRDASDVAKVRSRSGGKFAAEMDDDWLAKYEEIKGDNRQISLLAANTAQSTAKTDYQRTTIGNAAEAQLHEVMQEIIPGFSQVNAPVDIYTYEKSNWSKGTEHATKQRALKFLEERKKIGVHFGAGSGKTGIMLGSFTHLHSQGKVKKMIVAVPSAILGQFVGEGATFLEPGKYNYSANLNWDREKRLAALNDPNTHIHVTTRESLSNDLLHLVETHTGTTPEQYRDKSEQEQKDLMDRAVRAHGLDPSQLLLAVDEAHDILARKGVDPSKRSLSLNALGHHSSYYMQSTGSPIKNDLSEMYAFLHSVAPDKFTDQNKFLKEYGANTQASRRALQRVIAPYSFAASTKPTTETKDASGNKFKRTLRMNEFQPKVQMSEHQAGERQRILDDSSTISAYLQKRSTEVRSEGRLATTEDFAGAWDEPGVRDAINRMGSADTWGQMTEEQQKQAIGGQVRAVGALKQTAISRLFHRTEYENNPKAQYVVQMAKEQVQKSGKAGVVFSASSQAAAMLRDAMAKEGLRVGLIDGSLNAEQKGAERLKFSPAQGGTPEYDILICTDCCQTGLNLTRGKFLVHYDVPLTKKAYEQRSARIHRLKQDQDTSIHTPMLDAPEERIAWARMERKGDVSSPLQSKAELIDDTGLAAEIERLRRSQVT